jgi:hypothetical protein
MTAKKLSPKVKAAIAAVVGLGLTQARRREDGGRNHGSVAVVMADDAWPARAFAVRASFSALIPQVRATASHPLS